MRQLNAVSDHGYRKIILPLFITLLGIVALAGCDSLLSSMNEEQGSASFNVLLTDAPFPFDLVEEANVTITEVQLVPADVEDEGEEEGEESDDTEDGENGDDNTGDAGDGADDGDDSESDDGDDGDDSESDEMDEDGDDDDEEGIITLKSTWGAEGSEGISYNLLDLRNGVTADLVSGAEIPSGTYSQVRLIVSEEATLVAKDGSTYDLKIPSGTTSGVKIQLDNMEIDADAEKTLVLDFNLEDSFVARGNVRSSADLQGIIFKPVVHLQSVTDGPPEENDDAEEEETEEEENEEENESDDSGSSDETDESQT